VSEEIPEMVKRVARALRDLRLAEERALGLSLFSSGRILPLDVRAACTAIETMHEPTDSMVNAAMSYGWQPEPLNIGYDEMWRVMIDAALEWKVSDAGHQ